MSKHRKIEVDGQIYYWTVGRSHVKIQGLEAIPRSQFPHTGDGRCSCGSLAGNCNYDVYRGIGPGDIAAAIKASKKI
jgi:hypothetical protein